LKSFNDSSQVATGLYVILIRFTKHHSTRFQFYDILELGWNWDWRKYPHWTMRHWTNFSNDIQSGQNVSRREGRETSPTIDRQPLNLDQYRVRNIIQSWRLDTFGYFKLVRKHSYRLIIILKILGLHVLLITTQISKWFQLRAIFPWPVIVFFFFTSNSKRM
jgi:hypothetical protein